MSAAARGLAFLAVLVALAGLAVARYAGWFDTGVPVTLRVATAGTQLGERAEVKVRGLVVGRVAAVSTDGGGATVDLLLDPDKIDMIPGDVHARLLPKTLFGERYVALVPPAGPGGRPLAAGDVIGQDRSTSAREVEAALDDLLPLLRAVPPQQLATTLGALSQGLSGRGEQLGATLVDLDTLVAGLNPAVPTLADDLRALATLSDHLTDATPDLLDALDDLRVPANTLVEQGQNLRALYGSVTSASDDLRGFLDANGENLIALADSVRPTLGTLARYAPEFPCLFAQINDLIERGGAVYGAGTDQPGVHITLEIVTNRGKYRPGQDEPRYADDRGPRCHPTEPTPVPQYPPDGPVRDGAGTRPASWSGAGVDMGVANSPAEQGLVSTLVAAEHGGRPDAVPGWGTLLVGPLYRGTEVRAA